MNQSNRRTLANQTRRQGDKGTRRWRSPVSLLVCLSPCLLVCLLCLTGCEDAYSNDLRYGLRTDPVLKLRLPDETIVDPDPPGQFPILSVKDFLDERNPYFTKNSEILKSENKDLSGGKYFIDPNLLNAKDRKDLDAALIKLFGTPAHPTVGGLEESECGLLKLSDQTLAEGGKLYRQHCLHCHGKTGNGRGPTARWVNPHPRDYRQGLFKFESVDQTALRRPPHREDLLRVLEFGIEGTAMPSFGLLPLDKREALVSYVIHLSLRGRAEYRFFTEACKLGPKVDGFLTYEDPSGNGRSLEKFLADLHKGDPVLAGDRGNVGAWVEAQSAKIKVFPYPFPSAETEEGRRQLKASVQRGQESFKAVQGDKACVNCHKDYGRQAMFRFDEWGTFARPSNLALGVFRGGRRPVDLYYRIHSGIGPSGMPAFGENDFDKKLARKADERKELETRLKDNKEQFAKALGDLDMEIRQIQDEKERFYRGIWDLVNFVQAVGDPTMRRTLGINID